MNRPSQCRAAAAARPPSGYTPCVMASPGNSLPGSAVQVPQVSLRLQPVDVPRHPVHPCGGPGIDRPVGLTEAPDGDMVHQRGEPCLVVRCPLRRTRSSPLGTSYPALSPGRVSLAAFPLARPLSSTASATAVLFGGFAGTTRLSDFPHPYISGVSPQRSLSGPFGDHPGGRARDLPVLAHGDSVHARVLRPRGVRQRLAITPLAMLPSASVNGVGGVQDPV